MPPTDPVVAFRMRMDRLLPRVFLFLFLAALSALFFVFVRVLSQASGIPGLVGDFLTDYLAFLADGLQTFALPVALLLIFAMLFSLYLELTRRQFIQAFPWTFLQVRVPETSERTPRGMEEVFNILHGQFRPPDLYDLYFDGYVYAWFSAEIRGQPENVSFYFRIPSAVRQLFEAAIYAQYPDAEIVEAEDYAEQYHVEHLYSGLDLWSTELKLEKDDAYPIKTYVDFEDEFSEEGRMVDSMAAVTEVASSIDPGEEFWIQILFRVEIPGFTRSNWQKKGWEIALKLASRPIPKKLSRIQQFLGFLGGVVDAILPGPQFEARRTAQLDLGVMRLTPGESDVVRAIQRNVSKVGFATKIRFIALGPKGTFARRRRIPQLAGIFRQFSTLDRNQFGFDARFTTSRPLYALSTTRQRWRKIRSLQRYQQRFFYLERGFILNSEELASIFHFPVVYTKTPTLEHARAKKGEPPPEIPLVPLGPEGLPAVP